MVSKLSKPKSVGKIHADMTEFEKANCAVQLKTLEGGQGYYANVKVPIDASSYYKVYLEAPSQTCMMELVRVVLFKKFRHTGME